MSNRVLTGGVVPGGMMIMSDVYTRRRQGPRRRRCPELYARIAVLYAAGHSLDAIGLAEGCSGPLIGTLLREAGVEIRPRSSGTGDTMRFVPNRDRKWRPEGDQTA